MTWLMGPNLDCQSCDPHSARSLSDSSCEIVTNRIPVTSGESVANCLVRSRENSSEVILDRKSTRLNSSHTVISYAVFCLKKKKLIMIYRRHKIHIYNTISLT